MSKSHKERVEEQKNIFEIMQTIERYSNIAEFESAGKQIKFVRHDGYTYCLKIGSGKRVQFKISIIED